MGEIVSGAIGPDTTPEEAITQVKGLLNEQLRR